MAAKREKLPEIVTPIGTFMYPHLTRPNRADNKDNPYPPKVDQYEVRLAFDKDSDEWQEFERMMKPHVEWGVQKLREEIDALPVGKRKKFNLKEFKWFKEEEDSETGELTGRVTVMFKTAAQLVLKRGPRAGETIARAPAVFDSDGNQMVPVPEIWGGTTGRVRASVGTYKVDANGLLGLTFYLNAVQVVDLRGPSSQGGGFDKVEGGYVHSGMDDDDDDGDGFGDTFEKLDEEPAF